MPFPVMYEFFWPTVHQYEYLMVRLNILLKTFIGPLI